MDIFVEQLIEKKKTAGTYVGIFGCLVGVFVVLWLYFIVLMPLVSEFIPILGGISFLLLFGLIYFFYRLLSNTNQEYEYCFTNGALDVDLILNRKNRRRFTSLNARSIEVMARASGGEFERLMKDGGVKKVYACTHVKDADTYYVIYNGKRGRQMLLFNPNEKIRDGFKRFNPQKVFLDD